MLVRCACARSGALGITSVRHSAMAYTLTIFPEDGGSLPHKLEEATSDQAAIAEALKIVEGRLGGGGNDPFVVREDGKVFYKSGTMPDGTELEWRDPPTPRQG